MTAKVGISSQPHNKVNFIANTKLLEINHTTIKGSFVTLLKSLVTVVYLLNLNKAKDFHNTDKHKELKGVPKINENKLNTK